MLFFNIFVVKIHIWELKKIEFESRTQNSDSKLTKSESSTQN